MTNFNDELTTKQTLAQKPMIPPASIRANPQSSGQNAARKLANAADSRSRMRARKNPLGSSEVWSSSAELFSDHMKEVENKWDTLKLNDDIWAKLIYFEQNRRLAKAYVSAPVLTVDGTTSGLDGFRIGLSGIDNTYRNLESIGCLRSIGLGIKLKIDTQGNILMRKIGYPSGAPGSKSHCSVWVKDWPPHNAGPSIYHQRTIANSDVQSLDENCMIRHIEQSDVSYKLFDMRKFRMQLEHFKASNTDTALDWRQCVSIISFVQAADDTGVGQCSTSILEDPCWLMIINIIAIDMLKSSICDKPARAGFSSLIHNHSVLESRDRPLSRQNISSSRTGTSVSVPLQTSSLINTNRTLIGNDSTATGNTVYQEGFGDDRVKKLRTTNNRYRPTPISRGGIRRFQSTQQLNSENSTIYTTFNGKYCNSSSLADNSSISDYNSASRGISRQRYWRHQQPYYPIMDPIRQRIRSNDTNHYRNNRGSSTPRSAIFDTSNKSLSLSSSDLSSGRLDLKSMHSSIKMNFDYLTETDDGPEVSTIERGASGKSLHKYTNEKSSASMSSRNVLSPSKKLNSQTDLNQPLACCDITEKLKIRIAKDQHHVNHHDCQAIHGNFRGSSTDEGICTRESSQQKVSKSSIASSSSSSGCPDNEYFMSQSSSSMTSSSTSHERDPFSQPASSSGIAGSGNTSDEYEEGHKISSSESKLKNTNPKQKTGHTKVAETAKLEQKSDSSEMNSKEPLAKVNRRGKIKTFKTSGYSQRASCDLQNHEGHQFDHPHSECLSIEYEDCDCCCDCFTEPFSNNTISKSESPCDCEDEPIYGRGRRLMTPVAFSKTSIRRSGGMTHDTKMRRSGSKLSLKNDENILIIPPQRDDKGIKSSKNPKSGGSWLERHKYSRIFPKFIFSSHGNSGHV